MRTTFFLVIDALVFIHSTDYNTLFSLSPNPGFQDRPIGKNIQVRKERADKAFGLERRKQYAKR